MDAFPLTSVRTTAEIEEERRLLYVAMTRAKDDLHLVVPQRFFTHGQNAHGDRHIYAARTRFIPDELTGSLRENGVAGRGTTGRPTCSPGNSRRCSRPSARHVAVAEMSWG